MGVLCMTDAPVTRDSVESAIRNGMDWIVKSQITSETDPFYVLEWRNRETLDGRWAEAPVPQHLVGACFSSLTTPALRSAPFMALLLTSR
jgi:hypothetical protein